MMPTGYKRLDYIQSSGTQYIDTNLTLTSNAKIIIRFNIKEYTQDAGIYGVRNSWYSGGFECWQNSNGTFDFGYGNGCGSISVSRTTNYDYLLVQNKDVLNINGTQVSLSSSGSPSTNYSLPLFANNVNGTMVKGKYNVYYCKLYDGSTLVRDYIPSLRESDNEVGLYDLVNDVFYENQGTGTFTYGHILEDNVTVIDNPLEFTLEDDLEITANFKNLGGRKYLIGV